MNKKKINKKTVKWTIVIIVLMTVFSFLFMSPSFYYVDGQVRVFEPEEIDVTQLGNPGNLDKQSLIVSEMSKWAEKKSLLEIAQAKVSEAREEKAAQKVESTTDHKTETVLETEEDIGIIYGKSDPKDEHDEKYANQFVTKERGLSDEFYQNEENKRVILNFGKGNYDISSCVEKWMYGEPIVNLNKLADIMELALSEKKPDEFLNLMRVESYWPGDEPNLEYRYRYDIYLSDSNDNTIRYQTGSSIQEDNNHYAYLNTFNVEGDREQGYKTLVSVSEIPYYDGSRLQAGVPVSYEYTNESIIITLGNPDENIGYLAIEILEDLENATPSNAE